MEGYSPETFKLLWPPAWEATANAEGWTLCVAGGIVEVDLCPPASSDEPLYRRLVMWLVLNAYVCGSDMHRVAWEFEFAANEDIYLECRVPGDGMSLVTEADGSTLWVDDETGFGISERSPPTPFESDVRYSG